MKRAFLAAALAGALLLFGAPADAAHEEGGGYVGIGGNWVMTNYDFQGEDYDNTWGLNAQWGYHLSQYISLGVVLDYLADSEMKVASGPYYLEDKLTFTTLMADVRVSPGLTTRNLDFFILGGLGYMWGDETARTNAWGVPMEATATESDFCGQLGAGVEIFPENAVSVVLDGKYVWGFNDMSDIQYTNISLGVRYNF